MTGAEKNGLLSLSFDELMEGVALVVVGAERDTIIGVYWVGKGYGLVIDVVRGVSRRRKVTAKEFVSRRPMGDRG